MILPSQKYSFYGYSKWRQIRQSTPRSHKAQSSNFMTEKHSLRKIYKRMSDVYKETFLSKANV